MAFLKRGKSLKVKNVKDNGPSLDKPLPPSKDAPVPPPKPESAAQPATTSKAKRRQSIFGRAKTTNPQSSSSRPGTAARDRQRELDAVKIEIEEGGALFAFPTPSPLVSPSVPPKSASITSAKLSPLGGNPPTPSTGRTFESAVGVPPTRGRSKTTNNVATIATLQRNALPARANTNIPEQSDGMRRPELRRKKSSWRTLGGLFSRKVPEPEPEPHPESHPEPHPEQHTHTHVGPQVERPATSCRPSQPQPLLESSRASPEGSGRTPTISSGRSRSPLSTRDQNRPETRGTADRASLRPPSQRATRPSAYVDSSIQSFTPPIHPNTHLSTSYDMKPLPERRDTPTGANDVQTLQPPLPPLPPLPLRLDMDIPNSELERYSVMFEKLLASRQSIAERRRSKSRKSLIGSSHDAVDDVPPLPPKDFTALVVPPKHLRPQRSLSSPQFKTSPSLAIRVSGRTPDSAGQRQSENTTTQNLARPRPRSRTAPPGSVSPVACTDAKKAGTSASNQPPAYPCSEGEPSLSPSSILEGENSLPPTPSTVTTCSYAEGDEIEIIDAYASATRQQNANKHGLALPEPKWEMLTTSTSAPQTQAAPTSDLRDSLAPRRSIRGKPLAPRVQSPQDLEERIVQVSVARQVSVSRARRHVEKANNTKPLAQSLKPRVVDMSAAKNRKSMFVKVEGGDEA